MRSGCRRRRPELTAPRRSPLTGVRLAAVAALVLLAFPAASSSAEEPEASRQQPEARQQEPGAIRRPGAVRQARVATREREPAGAAALFRSPSRGSAPPPAAGIHPPGLRLDLFLKAGTLAGVPARAAVSAARRTVTATIEQSLRVLEESPDRRATIGLRLEF